MCRFQKNIVQQLANSTNNCSMIFLIYRKNIYNFTLIVLLLLHLIHCGSNNSVMIINSLICIPFPARLALYPLAEMG